MEQKVQADWKLVSRWADGTTIERRAVPGGWEYRSTTPQFGAEIIFVPSKRD